MVRFTGVLTTTPRGGGGCLVPVPREVAAELGLKGMPKINAVIAGRPYRGSLMPMRDGTYCLGVLKSIQDAAGVGFGESWPVTEKPQRPGSSSPSRTRKRWRAASKRPRNQKHDSAAWRARWRNCAPRGR